MLLMTSETEWAYSLDNHSLTYLIQVKVSSFIIITRTLRRNAGLSQKFGSAFSFWVGICYSSIN
jgi:hypothetical protein